MIDNDLYDQVKNSADWLAGEISNWTAKTPEADNLAKQIAKLTIGKTLVVLAVN